VDAASLLALVRFHAWANARILTTAAGLSDEEFRRETNLDHGSAFQTLRHVVDVDWSWREFCIGNDVGDTYVWDPGFALDELPDIHAFCLNEDVRLRGYVESLDDAALTESIGNGWTRPRWLVVAHVVNHGTTAPQRVRSLPHRVRALTRGPRPPGRARTAVAGRRRLTSMSIRKRR
jgi:uncharacterized damage-inducible protein DinB